MKGIKRMLLLSGASLFLSAVLLTGSTFAWFTDSVVNEGNTVQTGELSVSADGFQWDADHGQWDTSNVSWGLRSSMINETNWEPGKYNAILIKVSNYHNDPANVLAAKISLAFQITENTGNMADALWYKLTVIGPDDTLDGNPNRPELTKKLHFLDSSTRPASGSKEVTSMSAIEKDSTEAVTIHPEYHEGQYVYYLLEYGMYTDAGNTYQNQTFGLNFIVKATQAAAEADGFGNTDYDKDAPFAVNVIYNDKQTNEENGQALQEAVKDAPAGATVFVGKGTYVLEKTLTLNKKIELIGEEGTVFQTKANYGIEVNDDGAKIENISFEGKGNTNTTAVRAASTIVPEELVITDCTFNGYDYPVYLAEATDTSITDLRIEGNIFKNVGQRALYLGKGVSGTAIVKGNTFMDGQIGIEFYDYNSDSNLVSGGKITIEDNTFDTVDRSMVLLTGADVIVKNNNVNGTYAEISNSYLSSDSKAQTVKGIAYLQDKGAKSLSITGTKVNGQEVTLTQVTIYPWATNDAWASYSNTLYYLPQP